ncbi:MAG: TadE/TadG family type IV pilus assembly protein [Mesorhizobium sp.]
MKLPASLDFDLRVFLHDDEGVAMTEALIAVPFLTFLAVAVLEFGSLFWQRQQMETGLRDAARYMARCRHTSGCDTTARNLAYYGNSSGTGVLRVPNWDAATSPIEFTNPGGIGGVISAASTHQLANSSLFGWLGVGPIIITINNNQRRIGW